jgi:hypothetical protein
MADYDDTILTANLPDASPTVLWATEPSPVKALSVPSETGRNTQAFLIHEIQPAGVGLAVGAEQRPKHHGLALPQNLSRNGSK